MTKKSSLMHDIQKVQWKNFSKNIEKVLNLEILLNLFNHKLFRAPISIWWGVFYSLLLRCNSKFLIHFFSKWLSLSINRRRKIKFGSTQVNLKNVPVSSEEKIFSFNLKQNDDYENWMKVFFFYFVK